MERTARLKKNHYLGSGVSNNFYCLWYDLATFDINKVRIRG